MLKNNGSVSQEEISSKSSIPKSVASDSESVDKHPSMDEEMHSPSMEVEAGEPHNEPG